MLLVKQSVCSGGELAWPGAGLKALPYLIRGGGGWHSSASLRQAK